VTLPPQRAAAFNARRHEKNTLKGFFDLALTSGMIVKGCTLQVTGGRACVGLPCRQYVDAGGAETWTTVIDFSDRASKDRFQKIALEAVAAVSSEPTEQEERR
jgi:hypothetical protein